MGPYAANGSLVIVALPGQIDRLNADGVYDQLWGALISGAAVIIVDFTATTFCDSAGMHRLIAIHKRAAVGRVQLLLVVPPAGTVGRVLELMGMDELLPVCSTVGEALGRTNASVPQQSSFYDPWHEG